MSSASSVRTQSLTGEGVSSGYELKCHLVNKCMQEEIGFGRYQWQLFILSGLGWTADNLWLQGVAVALGQVNVEMSPSRIEFATLSLYVGLIVGATTWGILADIIGRKLSFNITLFIAGVFGIASGAAPNFVALCSILACIGFGIGGNLPVDGALYLEHIPQTSQWTLTLLSAFWALGQLIASAMAWGFIGNYSCPAGTAVGDCAMGDNMGWRYLFYTLGGLTFLVFVFRFLIFDLEESSKFLIAKGRDKEAIEVLQRIAKKNGRTISLTLEQFQEIEPTGDKSPSMFKVLKGIISKASLSHFTPLFHTRRLAINTTITMMLWAFIGLAYPLFNAFFPLYLAEKIPNQDSSVSRTFRDYTIISVMGIPGSFIACVVIDWTRKNTSGNEHAWTFGGRKASLAAFTALSGVFLFLFTTSTTSAAVLGFSCAFTLTQNAMYGILYAYTPEVFPGPHRGTADAICSALNRIFGILAPIIKMATTTPGGQTSANVNTSIFIAASVYVVSGLLAVALPIETAGKAAL
ncbi:MFS general substrate transporter [Pterulicium gracile]|uniref:MFS general substrate transporter n=1 Tax=Pterulicium gracile TaxID=1884261 RepID=A0A5C3QCX5_9AGAR|nr:MFS general substrate transporter [Pterula gracilis]